MDPYQVLGLSPSATDEEVTAAYRKLAKKYHPDVNPGNKEAETKMREINAAYEAIKTKKTGGAKYERADGSYGPQQSNTGQGQGGYSYGDFDDIFRDLFGGGWQQGSQQGGGGYTLQNARIYMQNGRYAEALQILSRIPDKTAEWYYLSAIANAQTGNRVTALNHARQAARMEPGNGEYQQLLKQFEAGSYTYRETGTSRGYNMQGVGRSLLQLVLAQLCCWFCCR